MELFFKILLVFVPIAFLAYFFHLSPTLVFLFSALAIVPLAKYIGDATESLAARATPALGGLLNATFGNATELIIGIFALHAGLIDVVKASITGSIIGNLLLVLGSAIFLGGIKKKKQSFNATAAKASGSQLLLVIAALVIPAIFVQSVSGVSVHAVDRLSIFVSLVLILAYCAQLVFSLRTHSYLYKTDTEEKSKESIPRAVCILLLATLFVAAMSQMLVGAIVPLVAILGWSPLFIGVVVLAIIGNVAEHVSAISMAMKDKMNIVLGIAIGSATQIAMLVAPILVLLSFFFVSPMNLVFTILELTMLIVSVFLVNAVIEDGESNWLEGVQLIAVYLIIAVAFYFHP